jgi:hypothetical protein
VGEIDHNKLVAYAKKLNEECKTWSSRKLRMTYAQPEEVAAAERRERMQIIDELVRSYMHTAGFRALVEKEFEFTPPVTLTYALERLAIIHVKLWMLEDQVRDEGLSDAQIGELKRKIDYLNGVQRPRIVAAIGEIFAQAVKTGNEELVREPNLKDYKAR